MPNPATSFYHVIFRWSLVKFSTYTKYELWDPWIFISEVDDLSIFTTSSMQKTQNRYKVFWNVQFTFATIPIFLWDFRHPISRSLYQLAWMIFWITSLWLILPLPKHQCFNKKKNWSLENAPVKEHLRLSKGFFPQNRWKVFLYWCDLKGSILLFAETLVLG